MATRTCDVEVSFLDDGIKALNRNALDTSPVQQVYRTVSAILALVRVSTPVLPPPMDSHRRPQLGRGD